MPSSSPALNHRASEHSLLVSPGKPGKQSWGEGRGRTPTAAPQSCAGMKPVIFIQWQVGWRWRAPRRRFPWQENLRKQ